METQPLKRLSQTQAQTLFRKYQSNPEYSNQSLVYTFEYYFCNEHIREDGLDEGGFLSVKSLLETKPLRALNRSIQECLVLLQMSAHLELSSDGEKIRRKGPFSDQEMKVPRIFLSSVDMSTALHQLLAFHERSNEKIGCGVTQIFVSKKEREDCFFVIREDGTFDDFSYRKCVKSQHTATRLGVTTAFRRAVEADIKTWVDSFKVKLLGMTCQKDAIRCQLSGASIDMNDRDSWDVDHERPYFAEIRDAFLREKGFRLEEVPLEDEGPGKRLKGDLKEQFREFHRKMTKMGEEDCRLRIVLKEAHYQHTRITNRQNAELLAKSLDSPAESKGESTQ